MTIEAYNRIHALPEVLTAFGFVDCVGKPIDRDWAEMVYDAIERDMRAVTSVNFLVIRLTDIKVGKTGVTYKEEPKIIEITPDGYYAFRAPLKEELA